MLAYLPDHRPGGAPARGARRLGVRDGRVARGAAAHVARRRPVGAARPPDGRAHRVPHPRPAARAPTVNFLDLVVAPRPRWRPACSGTAWASCGAGFSWAGLAGGVILGGRAGRRRRRRVHGRRRRARGCWCRSRSSCCSPRSARASGFADRVGAPPAPRAGRAARCARATASRAALLGVVRRAGADVAAHPGARELTGLDRRARCASSVVARAIDRLRARAARPGGDARPPGRRPDVPRGVRHAHLTRRGRPARRRDPGRRGGARRGRRW